MFLFERVEITNFMSIGNAVLPLNNQGVVLIEGINNTNDTFKANGAGKSTIFSAITYALYDRTPAGLQADQVINKKAKKDTCVKLFFSKDGEEYRIERYRKHKKHKNKVLLFHGETDLTKSSVSNTNKEIQRLFGIDYSTYTNSIMYGQGESRIFSQATDKEKKEILENVTGIGIYGKAQDVAKEKVKEITNEIKVKEQEVDKLKSNLSYVIQAEQQEKDSYQTTLNLIQQKKDELLSLENQLEMISIAEQTEYNQLEVEISEIENKLSLVKNPQDISSEYQELVQYKAKIQQIEQLKLTKLNETQQLQKKIMDVNNSTNCYVCGAPLDAKHREEELLKLNTDIKNLQDSLIPVDQSLPLLKEDLSGKELSYNEKQNKVRQLQNESNQLNSELLRLKQEQQSLMTKTQQAQFAVDGAKSTLATLENVTKPKGKEKEKTDINKEIEILLADIHQLEGKQERYQESVAMFSNKGVRSAVLDLDTPFLNERGNKYLAELSGSDIEIKFSTKVENADGSIADRFDVEVSNLHGGETYKANSGGEKKRIDLAISFAIQDLVMKKADLATNMALYDECFESLDSIGCENVITLLKEKQKEIGTIFVITHNENLKPLFEKVITVKKEKGISSLVTLDEEN